MSHNYTWVTISAFLLTAMLFMGGCDDEDRPAEQNSQEAKAEADNHDDHNHGHHVQGEAHSSGIIQVQPEITQKNCPVMGDSIDPDVFVEHEGRKVYFCCDQCITTFEKDPVKYIAKLDSL